MIDAVLLAWIDAKTLIRDSMGLSNDALHIHIALLILLASAALYRMRPDRIQPWLTVMLFEFINEYSDLLYSTEEDAAVRWSESWHDIGNTMLWPTVILVLGRWLFPPRVVVATPSPIDDDDLNEFAEDRFE